MTQTQKRISAVHRELTTKTIFSAHGFPLQHHKTISLLRRSKEKPTANSSLQYIPSDIYDDKILKRMESLGLMLWMLISVCVIR